MDLKVGEREGGHNHPELWPWVLEKEGNLGREDNVQDVEDNEEEDVIDDQEENIVETIELDD